MGDPAAVAARTRASFATLQATRVHAPDSEFAAAMATEATAELAAIEALYALHARRHTLLEDHVDIMQERSREVAQAVHDAHTAHVPAEDYAAMHAYLASLNAESTRKAALLEGTRSRSERLDNALLAAKTAIAIEAAHYAKEREDADRIRHAAEETARRESDLAIRLQREADERSVEAERARRRAERAERERVAAAKREAARKAAAEAEEAERHAAEMPPSPVEPSSVNRSPPRVTATTPSIAFLEPLSPAPSFTSRDPSPPPRSASPAPPRAEPTPKPAAPAPARPVPSPQAPPPSSSSSRTIAIIKIPRPDASNDRELVRKHISTLRSAYKVAADQDHAWAEIFEELLAAAAENNKPGRAFATVDIPALARLQERARKLNVEDLASANTSRRWAAAVTAEQEARGNAAFSRAVASAISRALSTSVADSLAAHASEYAVITERLTPAFTTFRAAFPAGAKPEHSRRREAAAAFWSAFRPPPREAVVERLRDEERAFLAEISSLESYEAVAVSRDADMPSLSPLHSPAIPALAPAAAAAPPSPTFVDVLTQHNGARELVEEITAYVLRVTKGRVRAMETWVQLLRDLRERTRVTPPRMPSDAEIEELLGRFEAAHDETREFGARFPVDRAAFRTRAVAVAGSVETIDNVISVFSVLDDVRDKAVKRVDDEANRIFRTVWGALHRAWADYQAWEAETTLRRGSAEFVSTATTRFWQPFITAAKMASDEQITAAEAVLTDVRALEHAVVEAHAEILQALPAVERRGAEPAAKRVQGELGAVEACPVCVRRPAVSEYRSAITGTWTRVCRDQRCIDKARGVY